MIATVVLALLVLFPTAISSSNFTASLNGASDVPPIPEVTATGTASFVLNDAQTQLTYHIEYSGLSSPETAAHVHNAPPKLNGPAVFALPLGTPKDGVWDIPPDMVTELLAGRLYVNVHTETYIQGEIRGNIEGPVAAQSATFGAVKEKYRSP